MLRHKKSILLAAVLLIWAMAWAVSANSLVDQRSVLSGRVIEADLVKAGAMVREGTVLVRVATIAGTAPAARANVDGVVREVVARPGDSIRVGDVVARIESAK